METLDDLLKRAAALRAAGRIDDAAKLLTAALIDYPDACAVNFDLALLFAQQRKWVDAERCARSAVVVGGDAYAGGLGHVLAQAGKYADAETWLRRALTTDPRNPVVLARLGEIYIRQKRTDEALACLESALHVQPDLAAARFNRDGLLARRSFFGNVRATLEQFMRHRGLDTTSIDAADIELPAAFVNASGKPRFVLTISGSLILNDLGAAMLFQHEVTAGGWEKSLRKFLDAQLRSDDVFIDVGAHWGIHSLTAATTALANQISVLAIEAHPENVERLRNCVLRNRLEDTVEVVSTAVGDREGVAELLINGSSMGHSLEGNVANQGAPGIEIAMTTLDNVISSRRALQWRRTILKIDVEGYEYEVLSGARNILSAGDVAAVIWENGTHAEPKVLYERRKSILELLNAFGFSHFHFDGNDERLRPLPTLDRPCDVYSLSPSLRAELGQASALK